MKPREGIVVPYRWHDIRSTERDLGVDRRWNDIRG